MELLPNGSDDRNRLIPYNNENPIIIENGRQYQHSAAAHVDEGGSLNVGGLIRRHWLLMAVLLMLGVAGGFSTVVLSSPRYKTRLLLEVGSGGGTYTKNGLDYSNFEGTE